MSFWNNKEPLGLPTGTVRAVLVLLFGVAVIFPVFKFAAYEQDIPQSVKEIMLVLVGGLQAIISKYFEIRAKTETSDEMKALVKREEEVRNAVQ